MQFLWRQNYALLCESPNFSIKNAHRFPLHPSPYIYVCRKSYALRTCRSASSCQCFFTPSIMFLSVVIRLKGRESAFCLHSFRKVIIFRSFFCIFAANCRLISPVVRYLSWVYISIKVIRHFATSSLMSMSISPR